LIEPGVDGLVVPPNDADVLADAISSLVDDPERAAEMGRAGREKALGTYAPERHLANLEELYADASSWVGRAT
jgi:starch synthase